MVTQKLQHLFSCEKCDYNTSRKSSYDKHILSAKHSQVTFGDGKVAKSCTQNICPKCSKNYVSRNGLWKHKKTCLNNLTDDITILTKTVLEVVKQNKELTQQVCLLSKEKTITNNINNSNNKNFNINFFLNEQCKDALNITDFVNSLQPQINDLEETGRLGFVQGISRIFINGLNQLDVHQRPLHCSDFKREIIYIKESNEWSKENDNKDKLLTAIKKVSHKNMQQIQSWQKSNPLYLDPDSKQNDKYMKIVYESMSGSSKEESEKNYNKIIKNIAKETVIEK
jgi:hypothetical protein